MGLAEKIKERALSRAISSCESTVLPLAVAKAGARHPGIWVWVGFGCPSSLR